MINFQELEKVAEFKNGELNWLEGRDINAVYVILVGNEYYIGSSHYTYLRIGQHLNELQKGCHHSDKLQKKFDEEKEFEVYSLDRGISKEELLKKEMAYIRKYKPSLNSMYSLNKRGLMLIKNEEDYKEYRNKLEFIISEGDKLGGLDFIPERSKKEYIKLSEAIAEYEAAYHPLPGRFSTLIIDAICDKMIERGINQKELSNILGISESRVSDLLNGRRKLNLQTARKLRDNLGISADFILDCYNNK